MVITYPEAVRWEKTVTGDNTVDFGKNNAARLRSSLPKLETSMISCVVENLNDEHIVWFEPWYQTTIGSKNNPKISAIHATTIGKQADYPYHILIIREHDTVVGAIIFSVRTSLISIAYRVFNPTWNHTQLQAGPALIGEYFINHFCNSNGFTRLSHGKDRNPYGLNANIGLALFKLSVGCRVTLPTGTTQTLTLETDTLAADALVMEQPNEGTAVSHAYLIGSAETLAKYSALQKYQHVIAIDYIERAHDLLE